MMDENTFPAFDAWNVEITGEPQVGIVVYLKGRGQWLSWDATVQLHQWLGELIKAAVPPS